MTKAKVILALLSLPFGFALIEQNCPTDFTYLPNYGCYHLYGDLMSWTEAFYYCQDLGGQLVRPNCKIRKMIQ